MKARVCVDCGASISKRATRCRKHAASGPRAGKYKDGSWLDKAGYRLLSGYEGHPNAQKDGTLMEHRLVMSKMLGRPLYPGENVHHKNGVRTDNRPENLELWPTVQPSGQRAEDLLQYAYEIIKRYEGRLP